ncbi:MAG: hypothetical protein A3J24_05115 [Deltaproteobacteria bacterium RIFCSPLOWO2_02_FULL_53_8]|nr:MAG: hypothetical protein A3J24_05115 [Deltaproteobacteria bacterium RIFCSPLOWO2_02_FULL_53_8]
MTQFIYAEPTAFIYALARVGPLMLIAPIFGSNHLPLRLRLGLSILLALFVRPLMQGAAQSVSAGGFAANLAAEVMTGLIIGAVVRMIFAGVEYAGQAAAVFSSFGIGSVYDKSMRPDGRGVPDFFMIFSILVFLSVNGHLMIIEALSRSFQLIPAGGLSLTPQFMEGFIGLSKEIFVVALKLSGPVMAASIFVNVVCGLAARSGPGLDGMTVSFAVAAVAGIFVILISLPSLEAVMLAVFDRGFEALELLMMEMRHAV